MKNDKLNELSKVILDAVFKELDGRRGFDGWFGNMDKDTQKEIKEKTEGVIRLAILKKKSPDCPNCSKLLVYPYNKCGCGWLCDESIKLAKDSYDLKPAPPIALKLYSVKYLADNGYDVKLVMALSESEAVELAKNNGAFIDVHIDKSMELPSTKGVFYTSE